MDKEERELYCREITDFRYGVISDLTNTHLAYGELNELIKQKAKLKHKIPYSQRTSVTIACIRNWLFLYRKYGKEGLAPKLRKDAGTSKALPQHESALILSTLEKKPYLTASSVVKLLQREGKIASPVSKSALSRLVIASGLTRNERIKAKAEEQNLKFDFFYPLDCVQADDLHAFPVPTEKGNKRKAILMAFIDDATRRILYAVFSFSERSRSEGACVSNATARSTARQGPSIRSPTLTSYETKTHTCSPSTVLRRMRKHRFSLNYEALSFRSTHRLRRKRSNT